MPTYRAAPRQVPSCRTLSVGTPASQFLSAHLNEPLTSETREFLHPTSRDELSQRAIDRLALGLAPRDALRLFENLRVNVRRQSCHGALPRCVTYPQRRYSLFVCSSGEAMRWLDVADGNL